MLLNAYINFLKRIMKKQEQLPKIIKNITPVAKI